MYRTKSFWVRPVAVGILLVGGPVAVGLWVFHHGAAPITPAGSAAAAAEPGGPAIRVKVIRPRVDPSFKVTVSQPCYVDPYYRIELAARVAGPVVWFPKAIGDHVARGEALLKIDAPDLDADVAKKEDVVKQRKAELEVAKALTEKAHADVDIATTAIEEAEAMAKAADATRDFRYQEWKRFEQLTSVSPNVVEERKKYYEAAAADSLRAQASLKKAKSELIGAKAKLKEAKADESYKQAMIQVAQSDRAIAAALLGYATVRAPWDGIITSRKVDPGAFVRSSATGAGDPLLTLERSDIVTVYMALPDNYAPFVGPGTVAQIEMSELPGVVIEGKVSRFSPSLINSANDRTMRVEMDLWNSGRAEYPAFLAQARANQRADLKGGVVPLLPKVKGSADTDVRLTPGMYGTMTLVLRKLNKVTLIPSAALFTQGGKSYLFLVRNGVARQYLVDVQVDDGTVAKVVLHDTLDGRTTRRDLTADDVIVFTNQGELSDGQEVQAEPTGW
jgi:multidrug resistance efflux pump